MNNLASHPLYLLRRFAGPLRDLRVVARRAAGGQLEEVRLVADGEHALGGVTMSLRAQPFMNRLTLLGSDASHRSESQQHDPDRTAAAPTAEAGRQGVAESQRGAAARSRATVQNAIAFAAGTQRFYPGIGAHLRALYAQVAAGGEPPVSAAEGRDVVAWYDEILAQSGIAAAPAALAG